ncbi:MAG: hypothetical protein KDA91_18245 [Planctomycetaceae bacterium]|nr:hypothetical protein [Planctomycetaceae bacterium]
MLSVKMSPVSRITSVNRSTSRGGSALLNARFTIFNSVSVAGLAFVLCLGGCSSGSKPEISSVEAEATSAQEERSRCEKKLAGALSRLSPDAMATTTRREPVVNALNSWLTECVDEDTRSSTELSEANAAMVSASAKRFATGARFSENDTLYIRDCLMLRALTEAVWKQADSQANNGIATDTERVVLLFDEVVRNVGLMPESEQRIPVGLYEVLLTGRGTMNDRISIFAEALRQRQLDAFILRPAEPAEAEDAGNRLQSANALIGVAVNSELLLFDPAVGSAVPKPGDDQPIVTEPAGMNELVASERWKNPAVQIVAHPAAFASRMLTLQEKLPAEDAAILYEELRGGGSEIQPLVDRIVAVGNGLWSAENVSVWNVPEERTVAAAALSETELAEYRTLLRPYDTPFERDPLKSSELLGKLEIEDDPQLSEAENIQRRMMALAERFQQIEESSEKMFGRASKRLLKTRLEQIMGSSDVTMIQQLQQIRIASMQETVEVSIDMGNKKAAVREYYLPPNILAVHRSATSDALYWTSLCQVTRGDHGASVTTFRNYRRQYPEGKWKFHSLVNEALGLIMIGDTTTAVEVLIQANTDENPEQLRTQWLLSRLPKPKSEEPKSEEPKSDEPKSDEPKSDEPKPDEPKPDEPKPDEPKPDEPSE